MQLAQTLAFLLFTTSCANAQLLGGGGGSGGGSSGIISGTTTCTSCPAGSVANSDGSVVTFSTTLPSGLAATNMTLTAPALGTPSSGVATNLTGTASGLTAGNVTTNANLTGVITSAGNATSIASQTGTGTKFVVDTSPTLVTPVLGIATATSVAVGGATIGANALAVTGTSTLSGNLNFGTAPFIGWGASFTPDVTISRNAAGVVQVGTTTANASGSLQASRYSASDTNIGFTLTANVAYMGIPDGSNFGFGVAASGIIAWGTPGVPSLILSRNAAGVVQVGTTAVNSLGTLLANTLRTNGFTVATLPAGVTGAHAYVTDQTAACVATGAGLTGGGAIVCPAFYNGSAWVGG